MKLIKDEINILCSSTKLPRKLATTQRKKTSVATERGRPRVVDVRGQLQSTPTKPLRDRVTIQTGNHRGDGGGGFIQTGKSPSLSGRSPYKQVIFGGMGFGSYHTYRYSLSHSDRSPYRQVITGGRGELSYRQVIT